MNSLGDGFQLPPSMRLFEDSIEVYRELDAKHREEFAVYTDGGQLEPNEYITYVMDRKPLDLPAFGSDEVGVYSISYNTKRIEDYIGAVSLQIMCEFFADKSPYVREGDSLERGNWYDIIIPQALESPPVIAQGSGLRIDTSVDQFVNRNPHHLTDEESTNVLEFLSGLTEGFDFSDFTNKDLETGLYYR